MTWEGRASAEGTERFRQRFASLDCGHFRRMQDAWASSLGLGTYLGDADEATDREYAEAILTAVAQGCNVLDSAINYRCQRSERVIGQTLAKAVHEKRFLRDEILVCTKGGYLPFDGEVPPDPGRYIAESILNPGLASYEDIVGGCHCISPAYLSHALSISLANLRLSTVDIYYLHNPEQQLDEAGRDTFMARMEAAFAFLEQCASEGKIGCYGIATWHGLRVARSNRNYLSLEALVALACRVAGEAHHFRAIQLPYNLAMPEAHAFQNQSVGNESVSALSAASRMGLSVMVSASLLQSRLASLPSALEAQITGLATSAQRAIQFVRSTPGVTTALIGMKSKEHVLENMAVATIPPMAADDLASLFDRRKTHA